MRRHILPPGKLAGARDGILGDVEWRDEIVGKNSKISWTMHTFNPWWGCQRVSPGCEHCYAETFSHRLGMDIWGVNHDRKMQSEKYWEQLRQWNALAKTYDTPSTVFVASMADIFEDRPDLVEPRTRVLEEMDYCRDLTFLILTKRPENIERMVKPSWLAESFPGNIWLGVTIESQKYLHRVAQIAELPVSRFVSVEPMLGPVVFDDWMWAIHWVICGGESGAGCRPMEFPWVYGLMEECEQTETPFFMKQLGGHPNKRDVPEEWPDNLRVQQFPWEASCE